jgi:nicotinamidase-related amidase
MSAADTGLVVIDVQEKLMPIVPRAKALIRNIAFLLDAAKALAIPVQATEQYPRGLGPTVAELAARLPQRHDKLDFSCCGVPAVVEFFHREARPKLLVTGMMTNVCVLHSVLDLLAEGFRVYVAADAVAASDEFDHEIALGRMEQAGAILTTAETAAFEWCGRAGTPEFKTVSKLVQERASRGELEKKQAPVS